jgi:hypothetical protein
MYQCLSTDTRFMVKLLVRVGKMFRIFLLSEVKIQEKSSGS